MDGADEPGIVEETWFRSGGAVALLLDVGRWRGMIAALPVPDELRPEIRFLAADVDGYAFHSRVRYSRGTPEEKRDVLRAECLRLLRVLDAPDGTDAKPALLEDGAIPVASSSLVVRNLAPSFFAGEIVPASDDGPALSDPEIARRLRPASAGGDTEAAAVEATGVWEDNMARIVGRRGELPGRFTRHALAWIEPRLRSEVRRTHADRPWIARTLDSGPSGMPDFVDALPEGMRGSTPGSADVADVFVRTQRMGHRGGWIWPISGASVRSWDAHRPAPGRVPRGLHKPTLILASILPPSWMPTSSDGWKHLSVLSHLVGCSFVHRREDVPRLLAHSGGDWPALFSAIGVDPEEEGSIGRFMVDVSDMHAHVESRIVRPSLGHLGDPVADAAARSATTARLLTEDGGIVRLARASVRWHEVQHRLPVPSVVGSRDDRWTPLSEPFRTPDGRSLRFLTDGADMAEEGEAMAHCVSSYSDACRSGSIHVASVASTDGTRLSTVEIGIRSGVPVVLQHRGRSNGPPPAEAEAVVAAWLERAVAEDVGRGRVEYDPTVRIGAGAARRFEIPEIGTPADWRGILRKRLTRMTWEELAQEIGTIAREEIARSGRVP